MSLYNSSEGITILNFEELRKEVEIIFKNYFGDSKTDDKTPNGLLINFITEAMFNLLTVMLRIDQGDNLLTAENSELDSIGEIFNLTRIEGEEDDEFRNRILDNKNPDVGTRVSIEEALRKIEGVKNVYVYDISSQKDELTLQLGGIYPVIQLDTDINDTIREEIAKTIYNKRACGVITSYIPEVDSSYYELFVINDENEIPNEEKWMMVKEIYVYANVYIESTNPNFKPEISLSKQDEIREKIQKYWGIGSNVALSRIDDVVGCELEYLKTKEVSIVVKDTNTTQPALDEYQPIDYISKANENINFELLTIIYKTSIE